MVCGPAARADPQPAADSAMSTAATKRRTVMAISPERCAARRDTVDASFGTRWVAAELGSESG
jgi:hypothetical protein